MAVSTAATLDWLATRRALGEEVDRVTGLLRSARRIDRPALGRWNLIEVAMHLSQAYLVVPALARHDLAPASQEVLWVPAMDSGSLLVDLWELEEVTMEGVRSDPERDPRVVADRIELRAAEFLTESASRSPEEVCPWLVDGVRVPLARLACHLLNETVVHGRDIAVAEGRRWRIDPAHAALVVDGFLMPMVAALGPRTMVDQEKAAGLKACFEIRVRGGGRHYFSFDDGALTVTGEPQGKVHCRLSVDPAAFLLVAWGRTSQWRAIARGQLLAWGRRPWLGPQLRGLMRNP